MTVDEFLAVLAPPVRRLVAGLRKLVRQAAPGTSESVLWGSLSYHVPELGGRVKGAVCLITPRRGYVELGFIHGVLLPDPARLLSGEQKEKRVCRVQSLETLPRRELTALIRAAREVRPGATSLRPARRRRPAMSGGTLLSFTGSLRRDRAVDRWMTEHPGELGAIAKSWFEVIRACGDDVRELLHDGHPTACVKDAAFAYVNAFKAHVNVGFFRGAELADPAGLLEGTGRFMRHVKVRPADAVDERALRGLIRAAYADIKTRLPAKTDRMSDAG